MSEAKPAIFGSAITAWREGITALTRMPVLVGIALVITLVLSFIVLQLTPPIAEDEVPSAGTQLLNFIYGIVQAFFIAPVAIAVHRHVLLGEITTSYNLNPSDPRFVRFFLFSVVLQFLVTIPSAIMTLSASSEGASALIAGTVGFVLLIIAIIVMLRTLILFPAIAVDAPNADWGNAMADTKGHSWRVFFILVVTFLPAMIIWMIVYQLFGWPGSSGGIGLAVVQSVVGILVFAALVAMASHLYAAFSERLGRPAGLQRA